MPVGDQNPKRLIVEGEDDKFAVVSLMEKHVDWPDGVANSPVYIQALGGVEKILDPAYLRVEIKAANRQALGVLIDADGEMGGRYQALREACRGEFPDIPDDIPAEGLVIANHDLKRFGIWIMPDNASPGHIETFLAKLAPGDCLWRHALESVEKARSKGASFRKAHTGKAELYTWLSWQDPPGQSPGRALTKKILDGESDGATAFVDWFKRLYEL